MEEGLGYEWLPKAAVYLLGQLAIGVCVFRWVAGRGRDPSGAVAQLCEAWLKNCALLISLLLLLALVGRSWAHTAAAFGPREAWLPENLRLVVLESRWGESWRLQLYSALAMNGAALLSRVTPRGWTVFAASGLGLAVAMPLLGHAAGSPPRRLLHLAHNLSAALWLGTLGVMTAFAVWAHVRAGSGHRDHLGPLVARFSPLALAAAAVVAASGICAAWLYVGSFEAMWTTAYGRTLALKLAAVAPVLACGWSNWRRVRANQSPRLAWMMVEWMCALFVVGLTGILTETAHP